MDTIKESAISHKLRPHLSGNFRRSLSWRALPILVVIALLMSMMGLILPTPALAAHEGEQTADYLPSDTDLYLTINLDPGVNQLTKFWNILNYWWQDADLQDELNALLTELDTGNSIDIEDDVLPWLGPEIAIGVCNIVSENEQEPELAVFIGTTNKEASDTFFEDQFIPYFTDETGTPGDYSEIETLYFPGDGVYCAFTDYYIVISNNQAFLEARLDMILDSALPSLADETDFQQARSNLPERLAMLYCNIEHIWDEINTMASSSGLPEGILESFNNQIPSCFAASISFTVNGVSISTYCPLPEGATLPSTEPDLLQSTAIVPGGALFFASGQDANAYWEQIRSLISDIWNDLAQSIELPSNVDSFESMMTFISLMTGVNIDNDIFGWMTGECSVALLSLPSIPLDGSGYVEQTEIPDILIMFEVEDTSAIDIEELIDGINPMLSTMGESDLLVTSTTSIDGVDAILVSNNAITESGASPGWLFLDVDTTSYLVIGTTTDALAGAVDASQGDIPSLDDADEYQGVLSLLPETALSLGYLNLSQILDGIVSEITTDMLSGMLSEIIPAEMLSELESADFELVTSYLPLQCAVGCSCTLNDSNEVVMTGALYLLPPPMVSLAIPEGTNTVEVPEQTIDFSQLDSDVGKCAFSIDIDVKDAPAGACIEATAMKEAPENISSSFELAATDAGLSIVDIAYVIVVDKTNLSNENVDTATITMKVDKTWADNYGTGDIRIIRVSDGTQEVLPTKFVDYEGDYAVFEGTSENGLSYFALAAVSSIGGTNWALIGGVIGAVLFVLIAFIIFRRVRRAA